jgi:ankyrin repeat protein
MNLLHDELAKLNPSLENISQILLKSYPTEEKESVAQEKNDSGSIALHIACYNINTISSEIIQLLIQSFPDGIKVPNKYGLLPIHKAVSAPGRPVYHSHNVTNFIYNTSLIKDIIDLYPAGLLHASLDGQLPIHLALKCPFIDGPLVDLLINKCPSSLRVSERIFIYKNI